MQHDELFGRTIHYVDLDGTHYPAIVVAADQQTLTLTVITTNGSVIRKPRRAFEGERPGQWHRPEGMQRKRQPKTPKTPEPAPERVHGPGPDHDPED